MIDTRAVSQELQDKIFDQVRKGQEQVRKGQETVAEAIKSWTATAQAIAPQISDLPSWTARLPKPEELVANAHDFAGQLLAAQRKSSEQLIAAQKRFAEQARDAVAPLLALAGVSSARPASKPASVSTNRHGQGQHGQGQHRPDQHGQGEPPRPAPPGPAPPRRRAPPGVPVPPGRPAPPGSQPPPSRQRPTTSDVPRGGPGHPGPPRAWIS